MSKWVIDWVIEGNRIFGKTLKWVIDWVIDWVIE